MIDKMDQVIQNFCTKVSHRLQRATGLTCYFIARMGITLTALNIIASVINYFVQFLPDKTSLLYVLIGLIVLVDCVKRSVHCQQGDEAVGSNIKPAELIRYAGMSFWRVLWIGLVIVDLGYMQLAHLLTSFVQNGAFSLGCAIFYNFICITPLPPGTSKIREWLNGFSRMPELARARQEN